MILSKSISVTRAGLDISQELLAVNSGIPLNVIQKIEKGLLLPNIGQLQNIAEALNVDIEMFHSGLMKSKNLGLDIPSSKAIKRLLLSLLISSPLPLIPLAFCIYFLVKNKYKSFIWIIAKRITRVQIWMSALSMVIITLTIDIYLISENKIQGSGQAILNAALLIYSFQLAINILYLFYKYFRLNSNRIKIYME
jgi:transcriptional regulator with XRE-family HTH domain